MKWPSSILRSALHPDDLVERQTAATQHACIARDGKSRLEQRKRAAVIQRRHHGLLGDQQPVGAMVALEAVEGPPFKARLVEQRIERQTAPAQVVERAVA